MRTTRTLLYILTAVLSAMPFHTVSAQTSQDALYIFRNDGKFNAFFYGDIDHIAYSMVDTLGKKQKDYVVQEIYALDSVWRIPISAIDSVAFVTPKTVYKKDVVRPDKSISKYIIASDTINWIRLSKNTPEKLIPKKGDKLLIEEPSKYIPNGFGGKVTSVTTTSTGNYTVKTSALQLTDVYERLVMKGAATSGDDDASAKETRGIADGTDIEYKTKWDFGEIKQTLNIAGSQSLIEGMNGNASLSIDGEGKINFLLTPKVEARAFLFLDAVEGVKTSTFLKMTSGIGIDGEVSGALTAHVDIPFTLATNKTSIVKFFGKEDENGKFPLVFDFSAGAFLEAQGQVKSTFKWSGTGTFAENVTYMKRPLSEGVFNRTKVRTGTSGTPEFTTSAGAYSFSSGGYIKGELKFNNPVVKEGDLQLGLRGDLGRKLSVNLGKAALSISSNLWKTYEARVYDAFNYDDVAILSYYLDGQAYAKLFKTTFGPYKGEIPLLDLGFALAPDFKNIKMTVNEKAPSIVKFTSQLSRDVLMPTKVGFTVFKTENNKEAASWWYSKNYRKQEYKSYSHSFNNLDPGVGYVAMPKMRIIDITNPFVVTDVQPIYFDLGDPMIEVDKKITVGPEYGETFVDVLTNIPDMTFTASEDWIKPFWTREEGSLKLTCFTLPKELKGRQGKIHITGKTYDGKKVLMEKDIVVVQGEEEEYDVSLDRYELECSSAQTTQDVTLNIDWDAVPFTNVRARVRQDGSNDWIKVKWEGMVCHVTALPHFDKKKRVGYVDFYAYKKNGDQVPPESEGYLIGSKPVTVTQGTPIAIKKDMKFLGKWTYDGSNGNYHVEYYFGSDGTYREIWDTPSYKKNYNGTFVVNSYSEEEKDDVVMEASLNIRHTDANGEVEMYTTDPPIKLIKTFGYVDGKWTNDGLRELQIGWNTYEKAK